MGRTTLVLGGARSGKSEVAEALAVAAAGDDGAVTYVATGAPPDAVADPDWAGRVAAHRARRPAAWTTVEAADHLPDVLGRLHGVVLLDSLGTWVTTSPGFDADADELVAALAERDGPTIVVSDEVGMGVHPETEVGRAFRDALGSVNRAVSGAAAEAWLVVAGRRLRLERP
jgi:adenosylcobinamide kinase/adenosylcobinamide-phosphate guanylyltransferase